MTQLYAPAMYTKGNRMDFVIIGAGVAGLITAKILLSKNKNANIKIVERGCSAGGLLYGKLYENGVYFDHGTHIFQETGITELDSMMKNAIGSSNIIEYDYGFGDIAGAVYNGILQENSHFPDLRKCKEIQKIQAELDDIRSRKSKFLNIEKHLSLSDISNSRFGHTATNKIIKPIMKNMYGRDPSELSGLALQLPGITRILVDNFDTWKRKAQDHSYRAIIGVPEQTELPKEFQHGRKSFYSKTFGSRSVINGLVEQLQDQGVEFHFSSEVKFLSLSPLEFCIENENTNIKIDKCSHLIITSGVISAAQMLGKDIRSYNLSKPDPTRLMDIVLNEQTKSDLCFFYNYDSDARWYRVTNYSAFSQIDSDRRISVEVIGSEDLTDEQLLDDTLRHLAQIGFLEDTSYSYMNIRKPPGGFPTPSVTNMHALTGIYTDLMQLLPDTVSLSGIGTANNAFFQNEILVDIYNRWN